MYDVPFQSVISLCDASFFGVTTCMIASVVGSGPNIYAKMQMQRGDTALICAARKGHSGCARLLAEAGANKDVKDKVRHMHIFLILILAE